jgi:hypothetical protein
MADEHSIIFHYTNLEGFRGIVESKKLWCSDARYLNDYMEVESGKQWIRQLVEIFNDEFPSFRYSQKVEDALNAFVDEETTAFITSFCLNPDLLSQWRGYGAASGGLAIGFDAELLQKATGLKIFPVCYKSDESIKVIHEAIRRAIGKLKSGTPSSRIETVLKDMIESLFVSIITSKNESFKEEAEFRLVAPVDLVKKKEGAVLYRIRGSLLVPYIALNLGDTWPHIIKAVWIGPTAHGGLTWKSVREFLYYNKLGAAELHSSTAPYRT